MISGATTSAALAWNARLARLARQLDVVLVDSSRKLGTMTVMVDDLEALARRLDEEGK